MYKPNELRAELARAEMTQKQLAEVLHISPRTLSLKVNGHREFKVSEICGIIDALRIKDPGKVFFA